MARPSGLALGLAALLGVAMGPIAVVGVVPVMLFAARVRGARSVWPIVLVALVVVLASIRAWAVPDHSLSPEAISSSMAIVTVTSMPVSAASSERVTVEVSRVGTDDDAWTEAAGRVVVYLPRDVTGVSLGDELFLVWEVTPAASLAPGYRSFVRSADADGSAVAFHAEISRDGPAWAHTLTDLRRDVGTALTATIPGDAGALAAGIVTGDDSGLSDAAQDAFFRTGTSHITAVSGQNVALLLGVLGAAWRPSSRLTRVVWRSGAMVIVWGFVLMVGMEPPALRAATVATAALGAGMVGRRPDPVTLLSITLGGMAVWNPAIVSGIGFWLSAAASFALCSAIPGGSVGFKSATISTVRGVMAANIATMPVILWGFGTWSPASLLANVMIGPVMTATFPAAYGLALISFVAPTFARYVAWIPAIGLDMTLGTVHRLAPVFGGISTPSFDLTVLMVVGIPCAIAVLAAGRDLPRWANILQRSSSPGVGGLRALASGAAAGMLLLWLLESIAF